MTKEYIVFLTIYLFFIIISFVKPAFHTLLKLVTLNLHILAASRLSFNIMLLYTLLTIQIITFIALIKLSKSLKNKISYYIAITLSSIMTIVSITCSFGYYYVNNAIIDNLYVQYLYIDIDSISNLINFLISILYLFNQSLRNYFVYPDLFVQQTQFYLGLAIDAIILRNFFSSIMDNIKCKIRS